MISRNLSNLRSLCGTVDSLSNIRNAYCLIDARSARSFRLSTLASISSLQDLHSSIVSFDIYLITGTKKE